MTITTPDDITIKRVINTLTIKQLAQFTIIALGALAAIFLIACSSSSAYIITNRPPADCVQSVYTALGQTCSDSNTFSLATNPVVGIDINDVGSLNEFIVLKLLPFRKASNQESDITAKVQVSVFTLTDSGNATQIVTTDDKELSIDCSTSNVDDCKADIALTLYGIGRNHYYILLNFTNAQDLNSLFSDIGFTTTTLNLGVFIVKSLFLAAAIAGFYLYTNKIKALKKDFYCEEQKALQLFFPLIMVIDEPFSAYVFGGLIYTWIKITVYVGFSTLLVRLWLSTAHALAGPDPLVMKYTEHSQAVKIYLYAYAAVAWLTYVVFHFSVSSDPSEGYGSASGFFFHIFKFLLFVVVLAGLVWIGRSLFVIFKESNVFNQREGYFLLLSVMFFLIHAGLVIQGDLDPLAYDAQKLILFSGTSTLYVLCLAYMYLPNDEGISQANYLKKYANPGLKDAYNQLDESSDSPPKKKKDELAGERGQSDTQPLDIESA